MYCDELFIKLYIFYYYNFETESTLRSSINSKVPYIDCISNDVCSEMSVPIIVSAHLTGYKKNTHNRCFCLYIRLQTACTT